MKKIIPVTLFVLFLFLNALADNKVSVSVSENLKSEIASTESSFRYEGEEAEDNISNLKFHVDKISANQIQLTVTDILTGNFQKITLTPGDKIKLFGSVLTLTNISKQTVGEVDGQPDQEIVATIETTKAN